MAIGTTIDGLNVVTSLTAQDEVPVWDKEASGEPTKKITASNLAASVKSLASLPNTTEMNNAIAQSTAYVMIKSGMNSSGTVTFDYTDYKYLILVLKDGSNYRNSVIIPSYYVALLGLDTFVASYRCYWLVQSYTNNVLTYAFSNSGLNSASFDLFGIK